MREVASRWDSLLNWLGVGDTDFIFLRNSEIEEAAAFIAEVIGHFAIAVPVLLDGLTNDIAGSFEVNA